MPITWSNLKSQLRRTVLKDPTAQRWTDPQLVDAMGWALSHFAIHTALPAVKTYELGATPATTFTLPSDLFDDPHKTMLLRYINGDTVEFIEPITLTPGAYWNAALPTENSTPRGWWVWPDTTLNLQFKPKANSTLQVDYYATYPAPATDNSSIPLPVWATYPVCLLAGAFLQVPEALALNLIRQHATKVDSGQPEHNPHQASALQLMKLYQAVLDQYPPQDRQRHFRSGSEL